MISILVQSHLERHDASRYPAPGVLIEIGGTKLHLRCIGEGSPTVMMIAGSGAPSVVSYELQDRLALQTRVCSYDRAGLGWSEPANHKQDLVETTRDLFDLLDQAGETGPFILAPESFGGMIALLAAKKWPDRVAGLVLIDSSEPEFWFEKTGETLRPLWRNTAMMQFGWRTGIVRLALDYGQPEWIDRMSDQNKAWFKAVYSTHMSGYGEAGPAFHLTEQGIYESLQAEGLGDLPLIVLVHGKVTTMLSSEFEEGWMDAQQRLAALSIRSELIFAEGIGHV